MTQLGGMRANAKELTGRYISGQTFSISDVQHNGTITGRHFEDCDIYGPAILAIQGIGHVVGCRIHAPFDAAFITVDQPMLCGPIITLDCTFKDCRFYQIGFIGSKEDRDKYLKGTIQPPTPDTPNSSSSTT